MTKLHEAEKLFNEGLNCAQAITVAFGGACGMEKNILKDLACGFGGGCGKGEYCGAISGAIIVIGLKHGQHESMCKKYVLELTKIIEEKYGDINCRNILGCDISTEEGFNKAVKDDLFHVRCANIVQDTAAYLEENEI